MQANAQHIEWDGKYQLQLSDFQSASTQIGNVNMYTIYTGNNIDFSYQMSNYEFMLTKNFNSKVTCSFKPEAAMILAPDTATATDLLEFAKFDFDRAGLKMKPWCARLRSASSGMAQRSRSRPPVWMVCRSNIGAPCKCMPHPIRLVAQAATVVITAHRAARRWQKVWSGCGRVGI